jgi:hypothetical protein
MSELHVGDTVFFIPNEANSANRTSYLRGDIEHIGTDAIRVHCSNEEFDEHVRVDGTPENLALVHCPHVDYYPGALDHLQGS